MTKTTKYSDDDLLRLARDDISEWRRTVALQTLLERGWHLSVIERYTKRATS